MEVYVFWLADPPPLNATGLGDHYPEVNVTGPFAISEIARIYYCAQRDRLGLCGHK